MVRVVRRWLNATTLDAVGLFVGLLALYLANGGLIILADSGSNSYLPLSVLNEGNLSFTADEFPFMFSWKLDPPGDGDEPLRLAITHVSPMVDELREAGLLHVERENYFLVPSTRPGLYVNTFGPGAGLTAAPAAAVTQLVAGDLMQRTWLLALVCRLVAAGCVAASAVLVYLTARRFVTRGQSLLLTLAYGLGTCVWAISSQSLTQHGPNEFYLALGTYLLARSGNSWRWLLWAGAAYGAAAVCRPTSGVVLLAVGVYLLMVNRRGWLAFTAGALPLLGLLAAYNAYYLGSPLTFGQTVQARNYLMREFGSTNAWRTPLLTGLAGILISPSRGLLVYSPWLAFALAGAAAVWRQAEYRWLRPLTVAAALILAMQSKWFDWWGGWSYGYRPMVDTMPMLSLCVLPALPWLRQRAALGALFGILLGWSIFVQALGAWAFDMEGWNARRGFAVRIPGREEPVYTATREEAERLAATYGAPAEPAVLNIDSPPHTQRLWSLSDNQIGYYLAHFGEARRSRREHAVTGSWLMGPKPEITHYSLALALAQLGRLDDAIAEHQKAVAEAPDFAGAHLQLGDLYERRGQLDDAVKAYAEAVRSEPQALIARQRLGRALAASGNHAAAIEQYREGTAIDSSDPYTYFLLAEAHFGQRDYRQAIDSYREAIRRAPGYADAMFGLAWALATAPDRSAGDAQDAWGISRQLVEATRSVDPRALDTAAAAAAALGRYDDAVRLAEQALTVLGLRQQSAALTAAEAKAELELAEKVRARVSLYRRGEPYVEPAPPTEAP